MSASVRRVVWLLVLGALLTAVAAWLPAGTARARKGLLSGRALSLHRAAWPEWAHPPASARAATAGSARTIDAMDAPAGPARAVTTIHLLRGESGPAATQPPARIASRGVVPWRLPAGRTLAVPLPPPRAA